MNGIINIPLTAFLCGILSIAIMGVVIYVLTIESEDEA